MATYVEYAVRELSPESSKYVGPEPPSGTKRRPAKKNFNIPESKSSHTLFINDVPVSFDTSKFKRYVELLDPSLEGLVLPDFTTGWLSLSNPNPEWPSSADPRVQRFMHEHQFYDPDHEDRKTLNLINKIRFGTQVEQINAHQYNKLSCRVMDRVRILAKDMHSQGILEHNKNGALVKSKGFADIWKYRQNIWEPKQSSLSKSGSVASPSKDDFIEINNAGSDKNDTISAVLNTAQPSKPNTTAVQASSVLKAPTAPMLTPKATNKRKAEISIETEDTTSSSKKQMKASTNAKASTAAAAVPKSIGLRISAGITAVEPSKNSETADHVGLGTDTIRPPTMTARAESASPLVPPSDNSVCRSFSPITTPRSLISSIPISHQSSTVYARPMTPLSPLPPLSHQERSPVPSPQPDTPFPSHVPTDLNTLEPSPSTQPEIKFILQKSSRGYDTYNPIPASVMRTSTLSSFFALVSSRSNIPLTSINCLAFSSYSAGYNVDVIHKSGGEAETHWENLKDKMKSLYFLALGRDPGLGDFKVFVDVGDVREVGKENRYAGGL